MIPSQLWNYSNLDQIKYSNSEPKLSTNTMQSRYVLSLLVLMATMGMLFTEAFPDLVAKCKHKRVQLQCDNCCKKEGYGEGLANIDVSWWFPRGFFSKATYRCVCLTLEDVQRDPQYSGSHNQREPQQQQQQQAGSSRAWSVLWFHGHARPSIIWHVCRHPRWAAHLWSWLCTGYKL